MPVRKFLEAAVEVDNDEEEGAGETFLNVYEYFEARRMIPKGIGAEYERRYKEWGRQRH